MNSKDQWIIEFVDNSRHSFILQSEWGEAATLMKDILLFGKVNCTEEKALCERFNLSKFPKILSFREEVKNDTNYEEYKGSKTASNLITTILSIDRGVDQK